MRNVLSFMLSIVLVPNVIAGTIEGKASSGNSVVYVDTIAGKTFSAPSQKPLIDQKGLKFNPAVLVVQVGTTVDFQNDDTLCCTVSSFWPSISGNKKGG